MRSAEDKRLYQIAYRKLHKDKVQEKQRRYYQNNKEKHQAYSRNYYAQNGDTIRANAVRTGKILRKKMRLAVLLYYSNDTMACVKCGFSDIRALCLDHINGGGSEHRRKFKNGGNVWCWLARHGFPPGYQILCANCNTIKAREEDEYISNGKIKSDWRGQLEAQKLESKVGIPRAWEDRIK